MSDESLSSRDGEDDNDFALGSDLRDNQKMKSQIIKGQHFDEAVDLASEDGSVAPPSGIPLQARDFTVSPAAARDSPVAGIDAARAAYHMGGPRAKGDAPDFGRSGLLMRHDSEGSDIEHADIPRQYDPSDFKSLAVSDEIKQLFEYIGRYKPQTIDIETVLKPFIPEYIPSIGDIDGYLKIKRPDGTEDALGLAVLDEPCAKQSDPTVLNMQLRANSRRATAPVKVKTIDAEKDQKAIGQWMESITDLHSKKPPPTVSYTKAMPDIENLMQEWPPEFEEMLSEASIPTADLDVDLRTYARIACALLDIPVYKSQVESLHVLFSLYLEARQHQGFHVQ